MVMNERPRLRRVQSPTDHFAQPLPSLRSRQIGIVGRERAVLGKEVHVSVQILLPHAVTIAHGQGANRFPINHFLQQGLGTRGGHDVLLFVASWFIQW